MCGTCWNEDDRIIVLCRHDKRECFHSHLTEKQEHGTVAGPPKINGRRNKGYPKLRVVLKMEDERKRQADVHAAALSVITQRQAKRARLREERNVLNSRLIE